MPVRTAQPGSLCGGVGPRECARHAAELIRAVVESLAPQLLPELRRDGGGRVERPPLDACGCGDDFFGDTFTDCLGENVAWSWQRYLNRRTWQGGRLFPDRPLTGATYRFGSLEARGGALPLVSEDGIDREQEPIADVMRRAMHHTVVILLP